MVTPGVSSFALCRFFILRHGETDANVAGIIQGSSDISRLTERGKEQAARVGTMLFGGAETLEKNITQSILSIDKVYVSPLMRAQQTLAVLRQHAQPGALPSTEHVLHDLREIDLFEWEGRNIQDLAKTDPKAVQAWTSGEADAFCLMDGHQPIHETWARARHVWNTILTTTADSSNNTLMVCHGTLGQALLCTAFGWDASHFRKHPFPNCGMVEIQWRYSHEKATSFQWLHPEASERQHVIDRQLA